MNYPRRIVEPRWDIWECASWIETRDLDHTADARHRVPTHLTIEKIESAWRAAEIVLSGEVDGESRRLLTVEDAYDYAIELYTRQGKDCGPLGVLFQYPPRSLFPDLFENDDGSPDSNFIVVISRRPYPDAVVHDKRCACEAGMRHRLILGLLFDRRSVIERWPPDGDTRKSMAGDKSEIGRAAAGSARGKSPVGRDALKVDLRERIEQILRSSPESKTHTDDDLRRLLIAEFGEISTRLFNEAKAAALHYVPEARVWAAPGPLRSPRP